MEDFTLFGIKEITHNNSYLDIHKENIKIKGYTVVENVLDEDILVRIRLKLDELYEHQIQEFGSEEFLKLINDTNNVRAPLVYDELFLTHVAANPKVLEIISYILGDYFILMLQNGVINKPKREFIPNAYAYHRDINYQHFTSSRPLSLSAFYCIDKFSEETGGTHILPFTHKFESCPSIDYIKSNEIVVNAKPGSVIVFDSMMYHRSGVNRSKDSRRGINNMYVLPFIKQQISFPNMLKGRYSEDPFLSKLLGYESETDRDVRSFRQKRIDRVNQSRK
jgi:ectoine hydroxylase-related dioxygenase (phytanoyl-CoA dioxygenase family)